MLEPMRAGISSDSYQLALGALDTPNRDLLPTMADPFGNPLVSDSDHIELAGTFTGTRHFQLAFILLGLPTTTALVVQASNGEALLRFGLTAKEMICSFFN